ncbi:hypothetical protein B0H11DRAFT_2198140 [Mycena galericulata]|nr:hypothetical protein B0H11DRAFT_2198140 [Mycena galericulata]
MPDVRMPALGAPRALALALSTVPDGLSTDDLSLPPSDELISRWGDDCVPGAPPSALLLVLVLIRADHMSLFLRRTPFVPICGLFAACIALERAPVRALRRRIRTRRPLRYFSFYARPNHPGRTPEPRLSASHISTLRVTSPPRQRLPPRVPESDQSASPAQDTSCASSARPESTFHAPPSSGAALRAHNARRRRASSPPDSARLLLQRTPKSTPSALAVLSFPARTLPSPHSHIRVLGRTSPVRTPRVRPLRSPRRPPALRAIPTLLFWAILSFAVPGPPRLPAVVVFIVHPPGPSSSFLLRGALTRESVGSRVPRSPSRRFSFGSFGTAFEGRTAGGSGGILGLGWSAGGESRLGVSSSDQKRGRVRSNGRRAEIIKSQRQNEIREERRILEVFAPGN